MGSFLFFWIIAILLLILIVIGLIYFAYWLPKKFGRKKLGIWLSSLLTAGVILWILSILFADNLFSRSEAREKLMENGFELIDKFKVNSNHTSLIGDYNLRFDLTISSSDKKLQIKRLVFSTNYHDSLPEMFDIRLDKPRYSDHDTTFTICYQDSLNYLYESYTPHKKGIAPTLVLITISKTDNKLSYNSWDD